MKKHTPGPWRTLPDSTGEYIAVFKGAKVICPVRAKDSGDASLIAAAPELLEALKAAQLELNEYFTLLRRDHPMHDAYLVGDKVAAAIAKAESKIVRARPSATIVLKP